MRGYTCSTCYLVTILLPCGYRGYTWRLHKADVMMLTSWAAYTYDIALPLEASAAPAASAHAPGAHHAHHHAAAHLAERLALARFWWERAHLNGWGYGRSLLNGGVYPSRHRCLQARRHVLYALHTLQNCL